MLSKYSLFFSILLLFSFSTFVTINSAEELPVARQPSYFAPLSRDNRSELIRKKLVEFSLDATDKLRGDLIAATEGRSHPKICDILWHLKRETPANTSFEELCYKTPMINERAEIIKNMLNRFNKCTSDDFVEIIADFTTDFTMLQMHTFLSATIEKSKPRSFNRNACLQELKTIIRNSNNIQNDKETIDHIKALERSIQGSRDPAYPLLKHMVHPEMKLFQHAAKHLKAGEFNLNFCRAEMMLPALENHNPPCSIFRKIMLFYGPPGVGKTEMAIAIVNESGCELFEIATSQLDNQESGVNVITKTFAQAKGVERSKGVIIFIDGLDSRVSRAIDTKVLTEFDKCSKDHRNILTIIASNEFKIIDQHLLEQCNCVEFPCPDQDSALKILQDKAEYFSIKLSLEELKKQAKRMKGSSGRELTNFIQDVNEYIYHGKTLEEAIKLTIDKQKRNRGNNSFNNSNMRNILGGVGGGGLIGGVVKYYWSNFGKAREDAQCLISYMSKAYTYFSSSSNSLNNNTPRVINTGTNPLDISTEMPNTVTHRAIPRTTRLGHQSNRPNISNTNLNTDLSEILKKFNYSI